MLALHLPSITERTTSTNTYTHTHTHTHTQSHTFIFQVSAECGDILRKLLARQIEQRLNTARTVKCHAFFQDVTWALIRNQEPPIVPSKQLTHAVDTRFFRNFSEIDPDEDWYVARVTS